MLLRSAVKLALLAATATADYTLDLLSTLNSAGLTTFATTIGNLANSNEGKYLGNLLSMTGNNLTVFAPTSDAFLAAFSNGVSGISNQTFADTLSYNVASGVLGDIIVNYPDTWVIGCTYHNASGLFRLEGNKSQVLNGGSSVIITSTFPASRKSVVTDTLDPKTQTYITESGPWSPHK